MEIRSVVFWKIKCKFGRRILAFDQLLRTDGFQANRTLLEQLQVDSVTLSGLLIRCYACTSYLVTQSWLPPWSGPMWCLVFAVKSALRQNMVPPIGPEVRGRILQLDALKQHFLNTVSPFIGERYCL